MVYRIGVWRLRLMAATDTPDDDVFQKVVDTTTAEFSKVEEMLNACVPDGYYFKIED